MQGIIPNEAKFLENRGMARRIKLATTRKDDPE
jgi:hypothetical protein